MNYNLENKIAIVTGAAQGIGKAIAIELAKEKAFVVVTDIVDDVEKVIQELKDAGGDGIALKCDVSDQKSVNTMVKKVLEREKRIDILVNNAGIYPAKDFKDLDAKLWEKTISINLNGVFYLCKAVSDVMIKQKIGKIVNIASIAGARVGFQALTHYSASKGGVYGFTRALALDLAPYNINVNAIAPGPIKTPGAYSDDKQSEQTKQAIPLKRWGKPEEIGYAVVFLASEKADFITGELLVVDGGYIDQ